MAQVQIPARELFGIFKDCFHLFFIDWESNFLTVFFVGILPRTLGILELLLMLVEVCFVWQKNDISTIRLASATFSTTTNKI